VTSILDLLKDVPLSAVLREKIVTLESENSSLKVLNAEKDEKIRALEKQISDNEQHPADRVLSFKLHNPSTSESEIAASVGIAPASVKHWLEHMRNAGNMLDEHDHVTGEGIHHLSGLGLA